MDFDRRWGATHRGIQTKARQFRLSARVTRQKGVLHALRVVL
jgi:hypothetical protein